MNSFVSVEDEEINCETPTSFVVSSSKISCDNFNDEKNVNDSELGNESPVDEVLVNLAENIDFNSQISVQTSEEQSVAIDSSVDVFSIHDGQTETCVNSSVCLDFDCLPILMECSNGEKLITDSEKQVDLPVHKVENSSKVESSIQFIDSDQDSCASFGGFLTDDSNKNQARPRPKSDYATSISKINLNRETVINNLPLLPFKNKKTENNKQLRPRLRNKESGLSLQLNQLEINRPKLRPFAQKLRSKVSQNNSKSAFHPLHISSSVKFKKETHASRGKHKLESEEKKFPNLSELCGNKHEVGLAISPSPRRSSNRLKMEYTYLSPFNGRSLSRSSSEESFEGFLTSDMKVSEYYITKFKEDKIKNINQECEETIETGSTISHELNKNLNNDEDDKSEFIGKYCQEVGCTITWLENKDIKEIPININNGMICELHKFAQKIAWESHYVIIWILRLCGFDTDFYDEKDLKRVISVIKRRKAIAVNFSGKQNYNAKLDAFDTENFFFTSASVLEKNEKNAKAKKMNDKDTKHVTNKLGLANSWPNDDIQMKNKKYKKVTGTNSNSKRTKVNANVIKPKVEFCKIKNDAQKIDYNKETDSEETLLNNPIKKDMEGTGTNKDRAIQRYTKEKPNENRHVKIDMVDVEDMLTEKDCQEMTDNHERRANDTFVNVKLEEEIKKCIELISKDNEIKYTNEIEVIDRSRSIDKTIEEVNVQKDTYLNDGKSLTENNLGPSSSGNLSVNEIPTDPEKLSFDKKTSPLALEVEEVEIEYKNFQAMSQVNASYDQSVINDSTNGKSLINDELDSQILSDEDRPLLNKEILKKSTKNKFSQNDINDEINESESKSLYVSKNDESGNDESFGKYSMHLSSPNKYSQINKATMVTPGNQEFPSPSSDPFGRSIKGRTRKPTAKAQELYILKSCVSGSGSSLSGCSLDAQFEDDGFSIGKFCQKQNITINFLNSECKTSCHITNGVIFDLYNFFKKRNAKLTSLVHAIFRLKGLKFDKSSIISIMSKIHEMVKVSWEKNIKNDPEFPFYEFNFGTLMSDIKRQSMEKELMPSKPVPNEESKSHANEKELLNQSIKRKYDKASPKNDHVKKLKRYSSLTPVSSSSSPEVHSQSSNNEVATPTGTIVSRGFDLNVTQGYNGKVTRGDIVYLYTRWLKKKMEGQTKVFVTDLSSDVERLIDQRNVGPIRIPVGTLMSTSVKIFEEFRRLSKINMDEAKNYLLEDWIEDINIITNSGSLQTNVNEDLASSTSDHDKIVLPKSNDISTNLSLKDSNNELSETNSPGINKTNYRPMSDSLTEAATLECTNKQRDVTNNENLRPTKPILFKDNSTPAIVLNNEEYDVEKIVGYRIVKIGDKSITEYRIRWSGFLSQDDSWVNVLDLKCPEILTDFWRALNKQRALKNVSPVEIENIVNSPKPSQVIAENELENYTSFFGIETGGCKKFFQLLITNLKPVLIDYHSESANIKRVKVSKIDVLSIYEKWRFQNQEKLLAGSNSAVNVESLITGVKALMDSKKVRNFNPNCLIDACYRMSLMKTKLKRNSSKLDEYLAGDFMELAESSKKHQDFVRKENDLNMKKWKIDDKLDESGNLTDAKFLEINRIETEALYIAKILENNSSLSNASFENLLKREISAMRNVEQLAKNKCRFASQHKNLKALKEQNSKTVREMKNYGISDEALDDLLNIAIKKIASS